MGLPAEGNSCTTFVLNGPHHSGLEVSLHRHAWKYIISSRCLVKPIRKVWGIELSVLICTECSVKLYLTLLSVHVNINRCNYKLQPTRCNFSWIYLFLQTLYMFQAVPPPIIRSTYLYIQLQILSTNTAASCYRGGDGTNGSSYQQYWLTIPEAVCKVMCSWWWAKKPPETCRASAEINSRKVASCWL